MVYNPWAMYDRKDRVTRSPRLAAMGVATLSGLMLSGRDTITMVTMRLPRTALAKLAADILEPPMRRTSIQPGRAPPINPRATERRVARKATTSAWPYMQK